jgi:REP element-mobilizing transposase RayT
MHLHTHHRRGACGAGIHLHAHHRRGACGTSILKIHRRGACGTSIFHIFILHDMDPKDIFYDKRAKLTITYRNRPHWKQSGKVHFITWRQADSLAKVQLEQIKRDRDAWAKRYGMQDIGSLPYAVQKEHHRLFRARVEQWLDAGAGSCALRKPEARDVIRETLYLFDGERYRLGSFAIAGNHVHVLMVPLPGYDLSRIMHSWKSYTAKVINRSLGRTGTFWQEECFDHLVRSAEHLGKYERYIRDHMEQGAYVEERVLII